mmetsp:Transcript_80812/g.118552  ORF Transcript_80812/g.118552 Transcript_80812/m.118552 type:complete len:237 (-) Transcript_80812:967-1677(-)
MKADDNNSHIIEVVATKTARLEPLQVRHIHTIFLGNFGKNCLNQAHCQGGVLKPFGVLKRFLCILLVFGVLKPFLCLLLLVSLVFRSRLFGILLFLCARLFGSGSGSFWVGCIGLGRRLLALLLLCSCCTVYLYRRLVVAQVVPDTIASNHQKSVRRMKLNLRHLWLDSNVRNVLLERWHRQVFSFQVAIAEGAGHHQRPCHPHRGILSPMSNEITLIVTYSFLVCGPGSDFGAFW